MMPPPIPQMLPSMNVAPASSAATMLAIPLPARLWTWKPDFDVRKAIERHSDQRVDVARILHAEGSRRSSTS